MGFSSRLASLVTQKKSFMLRSRELQQKNGLTIVVLQVPMVVVAEVLMMLRDERQCDFGMCLLCHVIYSYFFDFVHFGCNAQASQLFTPVQASSPRLIIKMPKADVVDLSSSDTEALLDPLFVSLAHDSLVSHPRTSSDGDSFKDCPKANDMVVSVYVALSVDALSSHTPMVNALRDGQKSCVGDSSI
jgi:hypothetical protein